MLVAAMVGLDARSTMDLDATIKGANVNVEDIENLISARSLEGLVPDDDSVRLLSHELEEFDYTLLYKAYSSKGRNPAVDPKTMFKVLTYAYSQNIYSSRKI